MHIIQLSLSKYFMEPELCKKIFIRGKRKVTFIEDDVFCVSVPMKL